jgi:hypothetical protein
MRKKVETIESNPLNKLFKYSFKKELIQKIEAGLPRASIALIIYEREKMLFH